MITVIEIMIFNKLTDMVGGREGKGGRECGVERKRIRSATGVG